MTIFVVNQIIDFMNRLKLWCFDSSNLRSTFGLAKYSMLLILLAFSMFFVTCVDSARTESTDSPALGSTVLAEYVPLTGDGSINYALDWEIGKAVFAQDGLSWSAESSSGYRITVYEGALTTATIQMVDCIESETQLFSSFLSNFVSVASAGHGDTLDPTLISGPFVESLLNPVTIDAGTITDLGASYCQGHYVVSGQTSTDLPSLVISGSWTHIDSGETGSFELNTTLAWGKVHELEDVTDFQSVETVDVVVTRNLGTLFDEADFRVMTESEVTRSLLRQLTETATFSVISNR